MGVGSDEGLWVTGYGRGKRKKEEKSPKIKNPPIKNPPILAYVIFLLYLCSRYAGESPETDNKNGH